MAGEAPLVGRDAVVDLGGLEVTASFRSWPDSETTYAVLVAADGRVVLTLRADNVSRAEVRRLLSDVRPGSGSTALSD